MAKRNKISTLALFAAGTLLFTMAWLMPSFPLFAFFGLAPFIAIAANNRKEKTMWTSLELVLLGFTIVFITASLFNNTSPAYIIVQAMVFTMAFVGYTFVRKSLGSGVSIITIPLFWLALEYLILKWSPYPSIFLADTLVLKKEWVRWNTETGYLGASLWILISNTFLYQAILTDQKVNWWFVFLFALSVVSPMIYSFTIQNESIGKEQMIQLYHSDATGLLPSYINQGELIPRTSAWISVLILLFTLVKRKTTRK